jgi:hypothetical protein
MPDTTMRKIHPVGYTIGLGALAAAVGGGAIWLFTSDHPIFAAIAAFFAIASGCAAVTGQYTADCPHCGSPMLAGEVTQCSKCGEFALAERGALVKLPRDYVAESATFIVNMDRVLELGGVVRWPDDCCICGGPSTRTERLTQSFDSPGIIGNRLTLRFDVPHCQTHRRGVACGGTSGVVLVGLTFRSYRYYREFIHMNGIDQRRAGQ